MDGMNEIVAVVLPLTLLTIGIVAVALQRQHGGILTGLTGGRHGAGLRPTRLNVLALIAAWLGLTVVSMWCVFLASYIAVHALLFLLGRAAAIVGLVLAGVFLVSIPAIWGWAIFGSAER